MAFGVGFRPRRPHFPGEPHASCSSSPHLSVDFRFFKKLVNKWISESEWRQEFPVPWPPRPPCVLQREDRCVTWSIITGTVAYSPAVFSVKQE